MIQRITLRFTRDKWDDMFPFVPSNPIAHNLCEMAMLDSLCWGQLTILARDFTVEIVEGARVCEVVRA